MTTTSELIAMLAEIITEHGDLPIIGGYLHDDSSIVDALVLDKEGCETEASGRPPHGVFLQ
jgi:hypothetical protein